MTNAQPLALNGECVVNTTIEIEHARQTGKLRGNLFPSHNKEEQKDTFEADTEKKFPLQKTTMIQMMKM